MNIYNQLNYFDESENWGDPYAINHNLLRRLDIYRHFLGIGLFITCGTQGAHVDGSLHYDGKAADAIPLIPPGSDKTLLDCYLMAERFDFGGLGLYPEWSYQGRQLGGMHFDVRPPDFSTGQSRWIGYRKKYYGLTSANLKRFKIL